MLNSLQNHLHDIYRADSGYDVSDFLITDRALASVLGSHPLPDDRHESVFVEYDDGDIGLSVFLDQDLLGRVDGLDPLECLQSGNLEDLALILEGVSHFNYLAWSATCDKTVTLLELELQAEVDKFVATCLLALQENEPDLARGLHKRIFDDVQFCDSLSREQHERYRLANEYAARFCHRISGRLGVGRGRQELHDFYRMTQSEKISHIHALAWHQPAKAILNA
jgi:hypothetical protein